MAYRVSDIGIRLGDLKIKLGLLTNAGIYDQDCPVLTKQGMIHLNTDFEGKKITFLPTNACLSSHVLCEAIAI